MSQLRAMDPPVPSSARFHRISSRRLLAGTALLLATLACHGSRDAGRGIVATPPSSGTVWTIGAVRDRGAAPAAMLAFTHGLHVVVVDDDDIYAGTTRFHATHAPDGARVITLAPGLSATFVQTGESMQLRFSSGETIAMQPYTQGAGS